jgi:hypothetical protein
VVKSEGVRAIRAPSLFKRCGIRDRPPPLPALPRLPSRTKRGGQSFRQAGNNPELVYPKRFMWWLRLRCLRGRRISGQRRPAVADIVPSKQGQPLSPFLRSKKDKGEAGGGRCNAVLAIKTFRIALREMSDIVPSKQG